MWIMLLWYRKYIKNFWGRSSGERIRGWEYGVLGGEVIGLSLYKCEVWS